MAYRFHEPVSLSTRRLEAFTDGVFAIAATLLVLDLTVNQFPTVTSNNNLFHDLLGMHDTFTSFLISFLLLCLLWSVHARQFENIVRINQPLMVFNTFRLLGVVLVPFSTSLTADYSAFLLGRLCLPLNFLFILVISTWQWYYASNRRRALVVGLTDKQIYSSRINSLTPVIITIIVAMLAVYIGSWAFSAFVFQPLISRLLYSVKIFKRKRP
jgi:uncharacterized membrane protein